MVVGWRQCGDIGDGAGGSHEFKGWGGVDVGGRVTVAVVAVVGISGTGHVAPAGIVAVVAH